MLDAVRPTAPTCGTSSRLDARLGARSLRQGEAVSRGRPGAARGGVAVRRSHQHPVHLRHHRLSQGGDPDAPQHPQQRLFHRPGAGLHARHDRVCIPVPFYHCFGMVLGNLACTSSRRLHGGARRRLPGRRRPGSRPGRALHLPVRRADHVPRHPGRSRLSSTFDCSSLRTGIMAGAPCPVELMQAGRDALHMPQVAIGYGMTETSPLSTLSARDDPLDGVSARWAGCCRTWRSASAIRRRGRSCRAARRASFARAATA